ncbi:serine/threonine-protein kinase HipA [Butyrivibrio sp. INlla18]|uniref:type II toxin-antitoxin system HipA family toxin n=1 Tax=Butyrivibrio sp. INlla18 TaxID=1520806 RepID=UPI0008821E7C|nr:HipA domain-containing protein [Butyrivibrio sp. INlla18]SDA61888.1 serine/threonine-protein kinase HipA [Butyrivibrio sp. INlla18]
MSSEKQVFVYADFGPYNCTPVGRMYISEIRGKEMYAFEYEKEWLLKANYYLDPDLQLFGGRQYTRNDKTIFGVFADSCPDRWGRLLMKRREEIKAKASKEKPKKLLESDYLLGVYDESRMGGLRFKTDIDGDFVSNDKEYATPPMTSLRKLEHASLAFEKEDEALNEKWLKQLIAPGSSLGGARPKASVVAPDGSLWIAKFPSRNDDTDVGAWEMVVHDLALMCHLNVPEAQIQKFSKLGSTYLVKRFDRQGKRRVHFSSAMTMLGKNDGDDHTEGGSYLEIVSFLKANGASPQNDLYELWKRIVFSMAVSNTDDHFRNHGFILTENGWRLSPLYDVNPDIYGDCLKLNVDDNDSMLDFELAYNSAAYYGLKPKQAQETINEIKTIVADNWMNIAKKYGISRSEVERMSPAFSVK